MERMDLYDAQRRPLGRTAERGEKLPEGIYHLMAHILVFHPDGRILIQRRQPFKKYWSGLWDITTGGGALAGEDTARAAMREAREELGLEVELTGRRPAISTHPQAARIRGFSHFPRNSKAFRRFTSFHSFHIFSVASSFF